MAWETALITPFFNILKDVYGYFHRPKLTILPFDAARDLRIWSLDWARLQKVFTAEIRLSAGEVAKRCIAILEITKLPLGVTLPETHYTLHWADVEYSGRTSGAEPVDIGPEGPLGYSIYTFCSTGCRLLDRNSYGSHGPASSSGPSSGGRL